LVMIKVELSSQKSKLIIGRFQWEVEIYIQHLINTLSSGRKKPI
jgi:hypothetical protein